MNMNEFNLVSVSLLMLKIMLLLPQLFGVEIHVVSLQMICIDLPYH